MAAHTPTIEQQAEGIVAIMGRLQREGVARRMAALSRAFLRIANR